jgi:xylan 1,4-beta-xylosidase
LGRELNNVANGFDAVKTSPFPQLPIIISECDPEGCAACGMKTSPQNAYRNGTMYSSYTAAAYTRLYELADLYQVNLEGAVTWAFEFEDQPWFEGFRDLATNGVDKPVLNVFRMFGKMQGTRAEVVNPKAFSAIQIRDSGVTKAQADVQAFASSDKKSVSILLWNYHDDDLEAQASLIRLVLKDIPKRKALFEHYRIDKDHSNSYQIWQKMGSPQNINAEQYKVLEQSGQLALLSKPKKIKISKETKLSIDLPRQGVSLVRLSW